MTYVFDTSPLSTLFRNYYPDIFKSLWAGFDDLVANEKLSSTREVLREIEDGSQEALRNWAKANRHIFPEPTAAEAQFVAKIFSVPHFQNNIEKRKLLRGGRVADPFVIARAAITGGAVVTMETFKPNASDIPNICKHFKIPCLTLEQFMRSEGWSF